MRARHATVAALLLASCMPSVPQRLPGRVSGDAFATLKLGAAGSEAQPISAGKLSLAEAYKLALARSEQVSLAQRNIVEADIRHAGAWNAIMPEVSLNATATLQRERKAGAVVLVPGEQIVGGVSLVQPVFRRGVLAARAAGQRGHESAEAARAREEEQLARDVAEVFITVLRSRKLLELARTAVGRAKTQYDLAVGRVKAGQALKNAELLAVIDLRRAELQEVAAQRDTDAASVAFERLIGRLPPADLELPPTPAIPDSPQVATLARRRADLRALELGVRAAEAEEDVAAGQRWWPRVDVAAGLRLFSPEVLGSGYEWNVSGVLTVPLVQRGTDVTELALRANAVHTAQLVLEAQRTIVVEELERAAIRAASADRATQLAEKQREAAREHYKLVDKQVRLGAITFFEVTNAQAILVEAENAYEIASMDRLLAVYDYLFAIGAIDLGAKP